MTRIVLIFVGLLMIGATALPLWKHPAWWVRIFDFPRLQIAVVGVAAMAAYLAFAFSGTTVDIAFVTLLAGAMFYQGYMMFPYAPIAKKQVRKSLRPADDTSISLLFANVLMENRNAEKLISIIRKADPDVILTVETDGWWTENLSELERTHPHTVKHPLENTYGMLMFSRLDLADASVKFLIEPDIPSIHARVRLRGGKEVELRCLHPPPPFPTEDESSEERDAELIVIGKEIKGMTDPVVVLGDLNDVAWSSTNYSFQEISGLLDPRIGRGLYSTFHAEYPFMRFPLDHFFHSNQFRLIDFKRLEYFGSDHFPVYIKINYEPDEEAAPTTQ